MARFVALFDWSCASGPAVMVPVLDDIVEEEDEDMDVVAEAIDVEIVELEMMLELFAMYDPTSPDKSANK